MRQRDRLLVGLVGDRHLIVVEFIPPIAAGRGREGSNPAAEKEGRYEEGTGV